MLRRLERLLLDLSVCAIAGLCLLITVSVLLRALFNSGIPDTVIMVRELMVASILLPLAAATTARSHIGVEFLAKMMPLRVQAGLVIFGSFVGLFALCPLIYAGWRELAHTYSSGSFFFGQFSLPKWPGRLIFLIGLCACWLRLLSFVISDLRLLVSGEDIRELADPKPAIGDE
ncbi:TRAP transporter small permease [Roseibium aestuarii]|uniref:TRAP transporter small permease protein n=1 Tax=Roseibium aestuarii TaxID=2600299 RepID=A0ABW4JTW2_9HYPH|nr:TRAP transporter small permease [Roseibium aestuarii]